MALGDPFNAVLEARQREKEQTQQAFNPMMNIVNMLVQQEMQEESRGKLLEREYQLKQKYPDPFMAMLAKQFGLTLPGQETAKGETDIQSSEEVKKEFIVQNPKYSESDVVVEPLYSTFKGAKVQTGWTPKVNEKTYETRIANENKSQFVKDSAQDMLNTIGEIEKGINYFGAGSLIPAIPTLQPEKVNWQSNIDKLLSGKMIDLMTQMKEASKTGATGFGQLSEREGQILRDASTALKKTLSPKDAQKYLGQMKEKLQKVIGGGESIDENLVSQYMKKYPNRSREDIIKALQRSK